MFECSSFKVSNTSKLLIFRIVTFRRFIFEMFVVFRMFGFTICRVSNGRASNLHMLDFLNFECSYVRCFEFPKIDVPMLELPNSGFRILDISVLEFMYV